MVQNVLMGDIHDTVLSIILFPLMSCMSQYA